MFSRFEKIFKKTTKKVLTKGEMGGMIAKLSRKSGSGTLKIKQCKEQKINYPLIYTEEEIRAIERDCQTENAQA